MACNRSGSGHLRADKVGAATTALAAFEVAVAGGGATFAGRKNIGVHTEAHRTAGLAPIEACLAEDLVEAFLLGLLL